MTEAAACPYCKGDGRGGSDICWPCGGTGRADAIQPTARTATYALETQPDIVCGECDRPLPPGAPIGEALEGMADDKPVVLTVCVYCAMEVADV